MKSKIIFVLCSLFFVQSLSGCATSYGRQNDRVAVYFKSNAGQTTINCEGAAVELPGNLSLKQSASHDCTAKAPGYEDLRFRVWSKISKEGFRYSTKTNWQRWSKWTLGLGHLVAWPVDFLSGSMKTLENDHYDLKLRPKAEVSTAAKALDKTVDATRKIVSAPSDAVESAATTVMDAAVKAPAEALGLSSDEKRRETEQVLEGEAIAEHLKSQQP